MNLDDTIVALATASGPAALALVRVSGRRAVFLADAVFRGRQPLAERPAWTLSHGQVVDASGGVLDEVVVALYRAPKSYTGEDLVEFIVHGGGAASRALMEALLQAGGRMAEPGEFTRRAYLNGRMDLAQAESVVDLVGASTARARESALARLEGGLSRVLQDMAARTREILLDCEAFLDFQDQLPDDFDWNLRATQADALAGEVDKLLATSGAGRALREGARVVLCGRPNAGKSSLLNALLREERALVSEIPGTTRDVLRETLDIGGVPVLLVDTAGLNPGTADSLELAGMERAKREIAAADAVALVMDSSVSAHPGDEALAEMVAGRRGLVAWNKIDLAPDASAESIGGLDPVRTSATTGEGLALLVEALRGILVGDSLREPVLVGTVRQETALRAAREALGAAAERLRMKELLDTASFELREAVAALDEAVGIGVGADVLNEIFSRFCIGK